MDPNNNNDDGLPLTIHRACKEGLIDEVRRFLSEGIDIDEVDAFQNTPVYLACLCGHVNVLGLLLLRGAHLNLNEIEGERCYLAALNQQIRRMLKLHQERVYGVPKFVPIAPQGPQKPVFRPRLTDVDVIRALLRGDFQEIEKNGTKNRSLSSLSCDGILGWSNQPPPFTLWDYAHWINPEVSVKELTRIFEGPPPITYHRQLEQMGRAGEPHADIEFVCPDGKIIPGHSIMFLCRYRKFLEKAMFGRFEPITENVSLSPCWFALAALGQSGFERQRIQIPIEDCPTGKLGEISMKAVMEIVYAENTCYSESILPEMFQLQKEIPFSGLHDTPDPSANKQMYPAQCFLLTKSKLMDDMSYAINNPMSSDFIIFVEDRPIFCHRCILATRSPYFKTLFQSKMSEARDGILYVEDGSYHAYLHALEYIYTDRVTRFEIYGKSQISAAEAILKDEDEDECVKLETKRRIPTLKNLAVKALMRNGLPLIEDGRTAEMVMSLIVASPDFHERNLILMEELEADDLRNVMMHLLHLAKQLELYDLFGQVEKFIKDLVHFPVFDLLDAHQTFVFLESRYLADHVTSIMAGKYFILKRSDVDIFKLMSEDLQDRVYHLAKETIPNFDRIVQKALDSERRREEARKEAERHRVQVEKIQVEVQVEKGKGKGKKEDFGEELKFDWKNTVTKKKGKKKKR
eukprot:TRINITY_DN3637_c0_g1_i1.p1 TRINITY_DN3637_c0_g1~~TRINITY_DN3637_c0_g1_i1.p1  ORF type:complete len:704 (-),score=226.45 TRINITY_DN3637_c0_g1_i1:89-2155(-)